MIAEGRFSPDDPDRYHGLVHRVWHHDYFLVAADFAAYHAAQARWTSPMRTGTRWVEDGGAEHGAQRVFLVRPDDPQLHGRHLAQRQAALVSDAC